jgi:tRNA U34 5-methylaminomethyl-2-thiouridine-forming methyltransferase MnmC
LNESEYRIVALPGGLHSIHSVAHGETFHPVIGPAAEAEALHVQQLRIRERMASQEGEFVVWDVGLGAAANAVTVLRATRDCPGCIRLISFDRTVEPARFALRHVAELPYLAGYERVLERLASENVDVIEFEDGMRRVSWELVLGDFPTLVGDASGKRDVAEALAAPHAILFDPFSPARNPAMWSYRLFKDLYGLLDPGRACGMATYSRSTMLRVTLLLAGFYVGVGRATGEKEETTVASNTMDLVTEPLGRDWLMRAKRSSGAEPLWEPVYTQRRLARETWERLEAHRQFAGC